MILYFTALYNSTTDDCDPDFLTSQYNDVLQLLMDKHAPVRTRTITLRPYTPWFNENLRNLKRQKRRLERKYVTSGLEVHRQMYRDHCRIYNDAINSTKIDYYKTKISQSDQSQLFRMIDGFFKVKAVPPLPSHVSSQTLAEDFINYFH